MSEKASDWESLTRAALDVRARAHAPYSRFAVGAALLADTGKVFAGCNVENRSFGLTICAERSAVVQAIAAGARRIERIVVVADSDTPPRPCGPCLDTLGRVRRARSADPAGQHAG